jgi:hypothetical protein
VQNGGKVLLCGMKTTNGYTEKFWTETWSKHHCECQGIPVMGYFLNLDIWGKLFKLDKRTKN